MLMLPPSSSHKCPNSNHKREATSPETENVPQSPDSVYDCISGILFYRLPIDSTCKYSSVNVNILTIDLSVGNPKLLKALAVIAITGLCISRSCLACFPSLPLIRILLISPTFPDGSGVVQDEIKHL